ncbi:MAG: hypothetical protein QY332_00830 [Anaerolineales bacterium]|nr:MAG: hypothetical protein QY332_00830 [Anaerolineales bacterium]
MFWKRKPFPEVLFLLLVSAVVYLPRIGDLTYYRDDWYYIYDGMIGGAKVFHEMFRIDRPARGYFFELYFLLFGPNPLAYHIGAFLWRGLSAVGALWIFNMLWPKDGKFSFFAALLFAIYPGYFWWFSAIEYQPMIASLALQVFSIAFTLKAIESKNRPAKIAYLPGAILTGWAYIALVDYAIGMEAFRFLCVYLFVNRGAQIDYGKRFVTTLKAWSWTLIIPLGFIIWRMFFFTNERKATDVGGQLSVFIGNPVATSMDWFFQLYNSLLNLGVLAWINQFPAFMQGLRLRDTAVGLLIAGVVILLVVFAEMRMKPSVQGSDRDATQDKVRREALLLGGVGMVFGVLPVILANRYVNITGFSHYGLPASLAAAVFMIAFLDSLSLQRVRNAAIYVVVGLAALAHYGIGMHAVAEETALQKFWWQVSWRAPALRAGTTLVVHYPLPGMGGGYGLMEAANVIYFPEPTGQTPVPYPIAGLTLSGEHLQDILEGTRYDQTRYRSHTVDFDYGNLLVISQPTLTSCVHVIDGSQPLISAHDPVNVALVASSSKIENVITDAEFALPPEYVYGEEPEHGWCYYFQKAELASQLANWEQAAALGQEAIRLELSPEDRVEWLPFLKAYAITGHAERLEQLAKRVIGDRSLRRQACDMFHAIQEPLNDKVREVIFVNYCRNSN